VTEWQVKFSFDIYKVKKSGENNSKYTPAIHEGDLGVIMDTVESFSEKPQFNTR